MDVGTLLDFEARWPRHTAAKDNRIRDELGITPARFYQQLHRAARSLEGQAHDPITSHRLINGRLSRVR
ncbi:DUF3263 domain-containing protein [Microbacterium kunmingense]|uniref:DUF3263 domain-containing protein n=1 Tax=Microbacterium kunmingense TaxID=2915939 RepID=UPI003D7570D1